MRVVGIDPGKNGGIAIAGEQAHAAKLDVADTAKLFYLVMDFVSGADCVYLEKVTPSPPQRGGQRRSGGKSMFEFGRNLGQIEMALAISGVPVELVSPQKWQREFGVYGRSDLNQTQKKNLHKEVAVSLFPQMKITHALADALLIAEYGRRVYNPTIQEAIRGKT